MGRLHFRQAGRPTRSAVLLAAFIDDFYERPSSGDDTVLRLSCFGTGYTLFVAVLKAGRFVRAIVFSAVRRADNGSLFTSALQAVHIHVSHVRPKALYFAESSGVHVPRCDG